MQTIPENDTKGAQIASNQYDMRLPLALIQKHQNSNVLSPDPDAGDPHILASGPSGTFPTIAKKTDARQPPRSNHPHSTGPGEPLVDFKAQNTEEKMNKYQRE